MPRLPDGRVLPVGLAMLFIGLAVGLAALFGSSSSADAQSPAAAPLFRAVRSAAQAAPTERGVVRSRAVQIDLPQLGGAGRAAASTLELNLFDDVTLTAVHQRSEPTASGGMAWVGKVAGDPTSLVALVANDGAVGGTIATLDKLYRVGQSAGSGVVAEIDRSAFPNELPPLRPDPAPASAPGRSASSDDGSTIDVMVVYTAAAAAGAVTSGGIDALIDLAITETNTSYSNSGITQRLRLVHKARVSYAETRSASTDLNRLTGRSDGSMDEVHGLRDRYGADVVVYLAEDIGDACGVAWLMTSDSVSPEFDVGAFSVVARSCATGYYSFGHELGHNMGATHDRYVVEAGEGGAYSYSYGYVSPTYAWRTVMAYGNACPAAICTRIPFWSNPRRQFPGFESLPADGQVMGVAEGSPSSADNARTLNNTASTVANFRQSVSAATATPTRTHTPAPVPTATHTPTQTAIPTVTPTRSPTATPRAVVELTPAATNVMLTPVAGFTLSLPSIPTPAGGGAVTVAIDTIDPSALPAELNDSSIPLLGITVDLTIDGAAYHGILPEAATVTLHFTSADVRSGTNPLALKLFLSSDGRTWEVLSTSVEDLGGGNYRATATVPHFSQIALVEQRWRVFLPSGSNNAEGW